jgi:hypothetical protein
MRRSGLLVGIVSMVVVAACGAGGPGATSAPGATTGPGASDPAGSAGPTAGPAETQPGSTPAGATLPDPCTLITQEEATTAIAGPLAAAAGVEELIGTPDLGSGRECAFNASRDAQARVTVFPDPGDLWDVYMLQQGQFGSIQELAGVGEKAFTVGNYECNVVQDGVIMVVTLAPGDSYATDPEPRMIDLCKVAAARL